MDSLYSPWRMQYILDSQDPGDDGCVFCEVVKTEDDRKHLILHRDEDCYVIMNLFPYNTGHLLVVPYRHVKCMNDLAPGEKAQSMDLLVRAAPEPTLPMQLPEYEQDLRDRLLQDMRRIAADALGYRANELEEAYGPRPETSFVTGNAAVALLDAARDDPSALVAVGSRGVGVASRVLLGSVSTKLLRTARGPVLVHPRPGG